MWLRYVLVPGLTDDKDEMQKLAAFATSLGDVERAEILLFHQMGRKNGKTLDSTTPSRKPSRPRKKALPVRSTYSALQVLTQPSVVLVSKFASEGDIDNRANFETTTLGFFVPCKRQTFCIGRQPLHRNPLVLPDQNRRD